MSLLILLARLVGLIVFPTHGLIALSASNISHDMSPCRHVPLTSLASSDVHNLREEIGLSMLAAEVLSKYTSVGYSRTQEAGRERSRRENTYPANNILMPRQMGLTILTAINLMTIQVDIIRQAHGVQELPSRRGVLELDI